MPAGCADHPNLKRHSFGQGASHCGQKNKYSYEAAEEGHVTTRDDRAVFLVSCKVGRLERTAEIDTRLCLSRTFAVRVVETKTGNDQR